MNYSVIYHSIHIYRLVVGVAIAENNIAIAIVLHYRVLWHFAYCHSHRRFHCGIVVVLVFDKEISRIVVIRLVVVYYLFRVVRNVGHGVSYRCRHCHISALVVDIKNAGSVVILSIGFYTRRGGYGHYVIALSFVEKASQTWFFIYFLFLMPMPPQRVGIGVVCDIVASFALAPRLALRHALERHAYC